MFQIDPYHSCYYLAKAGRNSWESISGKVKLNRATTSNESRKEEVCNYWYLGKCDPELVLILKDSQKGTKELSSAIDSIKEQRAA